MGISKETLSILRSVRTLDICDALDSMGYQQRYEMATKMRPMYPDQSIDSLTLYP